MDQRQMRKMLPHLRWSESQIGPPPEKPRIGPKTEVVSASLDVHNLQPQQAERVLELDAQIAALSEARRPLLGSGQVDVISAIDQAGVQCAYLDSNWISRFEQEYGCKFKKANRRYEVSRDVRTVRHEIGWIDVFRVRYLCLLCNGYDPVQNNMDQSPHREAFFGGPEQKGTFFFVGAVRLSGSIAHFFFLS